MLGIYVWYDFQYSKSEYTGLAVAIAISIDNAIALVEQEVSLKYNERQWGEVTIYPLEPSAFVRCGSG